MVGDAWISSTGLNGLALGITGYQLVEFKKMRRTEDNKGIASEF